jgi:hypothetical protein
MNGSLHFNGGICSIAYAGFAEVALSGYPVEIASEALQEAAGVTLNNLQIKEIPRLWLEIVAMKN